jgi:hypothetical protein
MSPAELEMQPTIHLESKPGYGRGKYPGLFSKCIMGWLHFQILQAPIIREIPCIKRDCKVGT